MHVSDLYKIVLEKTSDFYFFFHMELEFLIGCNVHSLSS